MGGDEHGAVPEDARALIGATWEALAEERNRASRARRQAEARIAELEQALAAAREGGSGDDHHSDGGELADQLKHQRDELRAQVRTSQQALREAETQRERLATRLRRRERDQDRARELAQELAQERDARSAAQAERDGLAAELRALRQERDSPSSGAAATNDSPPGAQDARIEALESVNARLTAMARREAKAREQIQQRVAELEHRLEASRRAERQG